MKNKYKIFRVLAILFVAISAFSCKETWVMYDASQKDHLYFYADGVDTSVRVFVNYVSLALVPEDEVTKTITLKLMGIPRDYDREFKLKKLTDTLQLIDYGSSSLNVINAVEGEDFEFTSLVVPAHSVAGYAKIKVKRTAKLLNKAVSLLVQVQNDENFLSTERNYFRLIVSDGEPLCPTWWQTDNKGTLEPWYQYTGSFTPLKYRKMLEFFHSMEQKNIEMYEYFVESYGYNLDKEGIVYGFMAKDKPTAWAKYVLCPLFDYFKANYPDAEPGSGYTDGSVSVGMKGWRNPANLYR